MKKILTVCLCVMTAALMMAGCNKDEKNSQTQSEVSEDALKEPELSDLKIDLGNYKNVEVTIEAMADVTDEDVENQINSLADSGTAVIHVTDRAVVDGDLVNVDYQGYLDGKEIEGEKEEDYNILIGSGVFFDGAEKELIGVMPGDTKEIEVTYPESYPNEALAGKNAVYKIKVNAICEEGKAELNDDYVKELTGGECQNVGEYRAYLKKSMQEGVDAQKALLAEQAVWDKVIEDSSIENYPQELLDAKIEAYKKNDEENAELEGLSLEEYVKQYIGLSLEEYNKQIEDEVTKAATKQVLSKAIAEKEGIGIESLSDKDWEEAADWYGYTDIEQFKKDYTEQEVMDDLIVRRVTDLMMETAKVKESAGE